MDMVENGRAAADRGEAGIDLLQRGQKPHHREGEDAQRGKNSGEVASAAEQHDEDDGDEDGEGQPFERVARQFPHRLARGGQPGAPARRIAKAAHIFVLEAHQLDLLDATGRFLRQAECARR